MTNQQESPTVYKLVSISKQEGEFYYTLRNTKVNETGSKSSNNKTSITCFTFKQLFSHAIMVGAPSGSTTCNYEQLRERYRSHK